jgi:hypothetical protein
MLIAMALSRCRGELRTLVGRQRSAYFGWPLSRLLQITVDHIRALTAGRPIKPTSIRCLSAWQPNFGRRPNSRRVRSVQTIGTTSDREDCWLFAALECSTALSICSAAHRVAPTAALHPAVARRSRWYCSFTASRRAFWSIRPRQPENKWVAVPP